MTHKAGLLYSGRERRIQETVEAIYAAAVEGERWPEALRQVSSCLDCVAMNLVMEGPGLPRQGVVANHGFDPELVSAYNDHYIRLDPVNRLGQSLPAGGWLASNQLMSDREWMRTELYTDLTQQFDVFYIFGSMLERRPDGYSGIGLLRSRGMGPFEGETIELYERLVPHLQLAVAVQKRLLVAEARAATLARILDHLQLAILLVDARGTVVLLNSGAEALVHEGDGIAVRDTRLVCTLARESEFLRFLILRTEVSGGGEPVAGGAMLVSRPSGRRPLQLEVIPLQIEDPVVQAPGAAAAVIISDPEAEPPSIARRLMQTYGLTAAEARLAELLAAGDSLHDSSDRLGVSINTVRTQVRSVFDKTQTRRQGELLRLLLTGPFAQVQGRAPRPQAKGGGT